MHCQANLKDVQADSSTRDIYVGVIARSFELDIRRDIWIIGWEMDRDPVCKASINLVLKVLVPPKQNREQGAHRSSSPFNRSRPIEEVSIIFWESTLRRRDSRLLRQYAD